jgi:hypothetical protein
MNAFRLLHGMAHDVEFYEPVKMSINDGTAFQPLVNP